MRYLTILFIFICSSVSGQNLVFQLLFEQNGADSSGNAFAGDFAGVDVPGYSNTIKVEGDYAYIGDEYSNWESSAAYNTVDRTFSFSGSFRRYTLYGGQHIMFTNKENSGSYGFDFRWDETNQRLYGRTYNGTTTNDFYSANSILSYDQWYHVVGIFRAGSVTIYLDNTKLTLSDSTISTDWTDNKKLSVGGGSDGASLTWFGGYMDKFEFFDGELTTAQVDSIYTHRTTSFKLGEAGGGSPAYLGMETFKDNVLVKKYLSKLETGFYFRAGPFLPIFLGSGYDSTYAIAGTQYGAIPENVSNGDYVLNWLKNITYDSGNEVTFELMTTHGGAFSMTTGGLITVANATKINGKIVAQDTCINLIVKSIDPELGFELDTAKIWVKENTYCRFHDLDAGSNGTGTRASPFNNTSTAPAEGYGFFYKRGTSITNTYYSMTGLNNGAANPTILAAYGTGAKPRFSGGGSNNYWSILAGGNDSCTNIRLYDLHIRNYLYAAIWAYRPSNHLKLYNCTFNNNYRYGYTASVIVMINEFPDYVVDSSKVYDLSVVNCTFDTVGYNHGATTEISYLKGAYHEIRNTNFGPFKCAVVSGMSTIRLSQGRGVTISHSIFNNGVTSSNYTITQIQNRMDNATFLDCNFYKSGSAIRVTDPGTAGNEVFPDSMTVNNCLFRGQGAPSIYFEPSSATRHPSVGDMIMNNLFDENATDMYLRLTRGVYITRNVFKGGTLCITGSAAEGNHNLKIHYNLIYDKGTNAINLPDANAANLYNNTVNSEIILETGVSSIVRNNLFKSCSINTSNNEIINSAQVIDGFNGYLTNDFTLKQSSTLIDNGYDVGLTKDLIGTNVYQGSAVDIGCYEYIP